MSNHWAYCPSWRSRSLQDSSYLTFWAHYSSLQNKRDWKLLCKYRSTSLRCLFSAHQKEVCYPLRSWFCFWRCKKFMGCIGRARSKVAGILLGSTLRSLQRACSSQSGCWPWTLINLGTISNLWGGLAKNWSASALSTGWRLVSYYQQSIQGYQWRARLALPAGDENPRGITQGLRNLRCTSIWPL